MSSPFLSHTQEVDSIAHELKTDLEQGLSNKEAKSLSKKRAQTVSKELIKRGIKKERMKT